MNLGNMTFVYNLTKIYKNLKHVESPQQIKREHEKQHWRAHEKNDFLFNGQRRRWL